MMLGLGLSICASQRAASFTPAALANVAHWYRADQGITLNAGNVSQWNDLVGTAHLVQATAANQPAYNATDAGYGNQPTIQSSSITQWLAASGVITALPATFWIVGQFNTGGFVACVALAQQATAKPYVGSQAGQPYLYTGTQLNSGGVGTSKCAIRATTQAAAQFIGVSNWLTGGATNAAASSAGDAVSVFAWPNGAVGTTGKIAELIVQAAVPTAQENINMAAYFARYGITVT